MNLESAPLFDLSNNVWPWPSQEMIQQARQDSSQLFLAFEDLAKDLYTIDEARHRSQGNTSMIVFVHMGINGILGKEFTEAKLDNSCSVAGCTNLVSIW